MWRRCLRFLGPDPEADLDDELAFHLQMRTEALAAKGMPAVHLRILRPESSEPNRPEPVQSSDPPHLLPSPHAPSRHGGSPARWRTQRTSRSK